MTFNTVFLQVSCCAMVYGADASMIELLMMGGGRIFSRIIKLLNLFKDVSSTRFQICNILFIQQWRQSLRTPPATNMGKPMAKRIEPTVEKRANFIF